MKPPFVADIADMSHSELDDALRATELELRALNARRARVLSAASSAPAAECSPAQHAKPLSCSPTSVPTPDAPCVPAIPRLITGTIGAGRPRFLAVAR